MIKLLTILSEIKVIGKDPQLAPYLSNEDLISRIKQFVNAIKIPPYNSSKEEVSKYLSDLPELMERNLDLHTRLIISKKLVDLFW